LREGLFQIRVIANLGFQLSNVTFNPITVLSLMMLLNLWLLRSGLMSKDNLETHGINNLTGI
jgi:hypothetical protein